MTFLKRFVLTGGPCGGKTTILQMLMDRLRDLGYRVLVVPEAATIVIRNFPDIAHIITNDRLRYRSIQRTIIRVNYELERLLLATSAREEKTIVICDRNVTDARAYMEDAMYQDVLNEQMLHADLERDRFDGVLFLVTAADGAEMFYSSENNAARYETPEQARARDQQLRKVWTGTPRLAIIDNSTSFAEKQERAWKQLCHWVGIPVPVEFERKFLLRTPPSERLLENAVGVPIEQLYLRGADGGERIRRRGKGRSATYYHTKKENRPGGGRVEYEEAIDMEAYLDLMSEQDPSTKIIRKTRYCFLSDNQYCELDDFGDGLWMLEIEGTEANMTCTPPPWLSIAREVTNDPAFTNYAISKRI